MMNLPSDFQYDLLAADDDGEVEYEDSLQDILSPDAADGLIEEYGITGTILQIDAVPTETAAVTSEPLAPAMDVNPTAPEEVIPFPLLQQLLISIPLEISAAPDAVAGQAAAPPVGTTQGPAAGSGSQARSDAPSLCSILSSWTKASSGLQLQHFFEIMAMVDAQPALSELRSKPALAQDLPSDGSCIYTEFPKQLALKGPCVFLGPYKWPKGRNVEMGGWRSGSCCDSKGGMAMWMVNGRIRETKDADGQVEAGVSLRRYARVKDAAGAADGQLPPDLPAGATWGKQPRDIARKGKPERLVWVDENVALWEVVAPGSSARGSSPTGDGAGAAGAADAAGTTSQAAAGDVVGANLLPEAIGQSASAGGAGAGTGCVAAASLAGATSAGRGAPALPLAPAAGPSHRGITRQREAPPEPQLTVLSAEQAMALEHAKHQRQTAGDDLLLAVASGEEPEHIRHLQDQWERLAGPGEAEPVDCFTRSLLHLAVTEVTEWPPRTDPKAPPPPSVPLPPMSWRVAVVRHLCERAQGKGRLQQVLHAKNNNGAIPLVTAGHCGHPQVLRVLLEYYSYEEMVAVELSSKDGWHVWHKLSSQGHREALRLVLTELRDKHREYCTQQRDEAGSSAQRPRRDSSSGADGAVRQQVEPLRLYHISNKYYNLSDAGKLLDQVCAELDMPEPLARPAGP